MTHVQPHPARADVYARITAEIVAAIEKGASDWRMPWHHDGSSIARPANFATRRSYRGANTVALWVAAAARGYGSGLWGTYKQFQSAGAQVRKGESATTVVLWKEARRAHKHASGDEDAEGRFLLARAFSVFNVDQVDNYERPPATVLPENDRIAHAEGFIANLGIATEFGGARAYYRPATDTVMLPPFAAFRDAVSFYGVWLHECGHATGAKQRLGRDLSGRFGSAAYAFEELIVEFLSGMVLADLGLAHHARPDHAAYMASWLEVLRADPRALFTAASKAQQAADWMHAQQPGDAPPHQPGARASPAAASSRSAPP